MTEGKSSLKHIVCQMCAQSVPITQDLGENVDCPRCGNLVHRAKVSSLMMTWAFSVTALIFYIPANIFPFMTVELYGNRQSSTIWQGIMSLFDAGAWTVALIVFLASMVIPFIKLAVLFYLSMTVNNQQNPRLKTRLYQFVEVIGRWSMLDIFLLAILVSLLKLGKWTTVEAEPGALMFALVVIFTMLASAYFDPKLLWQGENDGRKEQVE